jgi:hypothetical protein
MSKAIVADQFLIVREIKGWEIFINLQQLPS